jgi:chromosome segregation ATPase
MSGRKVAFGVYKSYIANMATKILTTDQKIDLILSKVSGLEKNQGNLEKNQRNLEKNQRNLEKNQAVMQEDLINLKREVADLVVMATDTLALAAKTADRVSHIESHLSKKSSFTPFTSGAFVA